MAATWLDVPRDIWLIIFKSLGNNLSNIIRFSAVCSLFQSIALDSNNMSNHSSPLLLMPRDADSVSCNMVSLDGPKRRNQRAYQFHLPELQNRYCYGSSYGWLFTIDLNSGDCSLLNPVNRVHISLPPIPFDASPHRLCEETVIANWLIKKAIISADPSNCTSFIVLLISKKLISENNLFWRGLSYWRPGDINWTHLSNHGDGFQDALCYMGKFYAVDVRGKLVSWDQCDINCAVRTIINPTEAEYRKLSLSEVASRYLVNSIDGTELLLVCEYGDRKFSVFKLDKEKNEFIMLERLGDDCALFLNPHCAFCIPTLGSPHLSANYIYSSKYWHNSGTWQFKDYAVYACNLDDVTYKRIPGKTIKKRTPGRRIYMKTLKWHAPCIWVIPSTEKYVHIITKTNMNKRKHDAIAKLDETKVRHERKN